MSKKENLGDLITQNKENAEELSAADKKSALNKDEIEKKISKLILANKENAFDLSAAYKIISIQKKEIKKREAELIHFKKELAYQAELSILNKKLVLANEQEKLSKEKYIELYNFAPTGYFTLKREGKIIESNLFASQILGKEHSFLKDHCFGNFVSEDTKPIFNIFLEQVFKSKTRQICDVTLLTDNNLPKYVYLNGIVTNNTEQCLITIDDITERKQVEKALMESEERFQLLFNKAPLGYQSLDIYGNFIDVNQQWLDTLGYTREVVIGKWFGDFLSPAYQDGFRKRFPIFIAQGYIHSEFEMVHKNGNKLFIAFEGKIGYDNNGEFKQTHCILQDITERKRAEEALRKSEALQGKIVANIGDIIVIIDQDGINRYKSPNIEKWFGWRPEEVVGESAWKNMHPDDLDSIQKLFIALLDEPNATNTTECRYRCKDGSYKWIELTVINLLHDPDIRGLLGNYHDITERKQAEEVLRESESQLSETQSVAKIGSWTTDLTNLKVKWSKEIYRIFEIDPDSFHSSHQAFLEFVHPEDRAKVDAAFVLSFDSHSVNTIEHRILTLDGKIKFVEEYWKIISDHQGKPIQAVGSCQDITERERAEEALRESEVKFRSITEQTTDLIAITDANGLIIYASPSSKTLFHYTPEEMCGRHFTEFIDKTVVPEAIAVFSGLLGSGKVMKGERKMKRKDGSIFIAELNRSNYQCGELNGALVIIRDITERKQAESELIKAKEHAEESDRLKSAFLTNMSHEIRTPMNGILGFAGLLKEPELSGEQQQEYIDIIEKSGARMLNIISDIVSISKIESGTLETYISDTNINGQTEYVYNTLKLDAEKKKLTIILKNGLPDKESIIKTDNEKFIGILSNLVKNAIKYTDQGSIEFGYNLKKNSTLDELYNLEFYIKDTGIGIPKDRQEVIFERFIQADIHDKMARQGAGLGLAISRAYVEMLGGKIWVESIEGKGSTFYFTLPYRTKPKARNLFHNESLVSVEEIQIKKLKILIVEDDELSEMLIDITVKTFGKEILKVRTGIEAVEACRDNPDIDLILMDIQMPEMGGYEATRQIRQFNKEVVIIAQTAFGLSGDREKSIESGCNDYIAKPINKDELLSLIQKYFKN